MLACVPTRFNPYYEIEFEQRALLLTNQVAFMWVHTQFLRPQAETKALSLILNGFPDHGSLATDYGKTDGVM